MATSTVPAFKGALLDALRERAGLKGVQVSWGWPNRLTPETVILGDVPEGEQSAAAMKAGRLPREEVYEVEVLVWVERGGTEQQAATERAFQIAAEIENELRDDPRTNNTVKWAGIAGAFSLEERPSEKPARLAILTHTIEVRARLA